MGRGVFKIATVGGIAIKAHWSWALIALLVTFYLAQGRFPVQMPGASQATYWVLGIIGSVLFFASVLLHELAHAFVARARGLNVRDIILFIFGGVANIEEEPKEARDEFVIAGVGPLTSIALAALFFVLSQVVTPPVGRVGAGAAAVFSYLAEVNWLLGLFNLIPGFPLDGGRVFRSIVWGYTRNFASATRIAGSLGQLVAYGFIAWGLIRYFMQGDFGGLWISFIGWFLLNAAQQSVAGTEIRERLRRFNVGQVMQPAPPSVLPHYTIAHILTQFILPYNLRALPVVQDDKLIGIVTLSDIKDVPQDQWGTVTVGDVMTGPDKLRVVSPQESLDRAMELLSEGDFDQLPVADANGRLVGMLNRAHVLRWLQIRNELKLQPSVRT